MNILFVLYDGYHSNSATFVVGYANALAQQGHSVAVATPENCPKVAREPDRQDFQKVTHRQISCGFTFPNGTPPDVVHAWTPRENVRKAAFGCVANTGAKLVVHLEDNEELVTSHTIGKDHAELAEASELELAECLPQTLSHPRLADLFVGMADAVTVVWPSLNEFVPEGIPTHHLLMCPPPERFQQAVRVEQMTAKLGIGTSENLIVYSGHLNNVNRADQSALYEAVVLLNKRKVPCRLIRTGPNTIGTAENLARGSAQHVIEAGLLSEEELAAVMRLATVFVQPGKDDPFNRYRMPCKIGEFLHIGCPVIVPNVNVAEWLTDGENALILREGSPEEIALLCRKVFESGALREKLAEGARVFAAKHFDLQNNAGRLSRFYMNLGKSNALAPKVENGEDLEKAFLAHTLAKSLERSDLETGQSLVRQLRFGLPVDPAEVPSRKQRWLKIAKLIQSEIRSSFVRLW
jgi:glycosyltransferase involved in cell wall biosynthesis